MASLSRLIPRHVAGVPGVRVMRAGAFQHPVKHRGGGAVIHVIMPAGGSAETATGRYQVGTLVRREGIVRIGLDCAPSTFQPCASISSRRMVATVISSPSNCARA